MEKDPSEFEDPFAESEGAAKTGFEADGADDVSHTGGFKSGAGMDPIDGIENVLECPTCEEILDDATGDGPADVNEGDIRVPIDCPSCGAKLTLVVASALPDALGADLSVEHRR